MSFQNLHLDEERPEEQPPLLYSSFSATAHQSVLANQLPMASLLYKARATSPDQGRPGVTSLLLPKREGGEKDLKSAYTKDFSPTLNKARTLFYLNAYQMPTVEEEHRFNDEGSSKVGVPTSLDEFIPDFTKKQLRINNYTSISSKFDSQP